MLLKTLLRRHNSNTIELSEVVKIEDIYQLWIVLEIEYGSNKDVEIRFHGDNYGQWADVIIEENRYYKKGNNKIEFTINDFKTLMFVFEEKNIEIKNSEEEIKINLQTKGITNFEFDIFDSGPSEEENFVNVGQKSYII